MSARRRFRGQSRRGPKIGPIPRHQTIVPFDQLHLTMHGQFAGLPHGVCQVLNRFTNHNLRLHQGGHLLHWQRQSGQHI
jgi:hypothetical protein